jgi:hypothetical protein
MPLQRASLAWLELRLARLVAVAAAQWRTLPWAGHHADRRYIAPESGSLDFSGGLRMRRELVSTDHDGAFCIQRRKPCLPLLLARLLA